MNFFQKSIITCAAAYPMYHCQWGDRLEPIDGVLQIYCNVYSQMYAFAAKCFVDFASFITIKMEPLMEREVELISSLVIENQSCLLTTLEKLYETTILSLPVYTFLTGILFFYLLMQEKRPRYEKFLLNNAPLLVAFNTALIFDLGYYSLIAYLPFLFFFGLFFLWAIYSKPYL